MKKVVFLAIILLIYSNCFAQEKKNHLTFKGIEINGRAKDFARELTNKFNYESVYSKENVFVLKGSFAEKDAKIFVLGTDKTGLTWKIAVFFEKETNWSTLKYKYNQFKDQLTKKYGSCTSYDSFSSPYTEGDGYEMSAISLDKCNYSSFWMLEDGSISIEINKDAEIIISYEDKINVNIRKKESEAVIDSDL